MKKNNSLATFFLAQLEALVKYRERSETHTHTHSHTNTRNNFMLGFQKFMHIFCAFRRRRRKKRKFIMII